MASTFKNLKNKIKRLSELTEEDDDYVDLQDNILSEENSTRRIKTFSEWEDDT